MSLITDIFAIEVLDSRGNPTVQVTVKSADGNCERAIVPSGASTGEFEAVEKRDGDKKRYFGKGVLNAVNNVNTIIKNAICGKFHADEQEKIDEMLIKLDGTKNKSKLGANAILGVSLALCRLGAKTQNKQLYEYLSNKKTFTMPVPMMNILNGGRHADNNLDFQEFMIMPISAKSFKEALEMGAKIFGNLKLLLKQNNLNTNVGDEGGFAPNLKSNYDALNFLKMATIKSGYELKKDIYFAIDVASSEFYDKNSKTYILQGENKRLSRDEMIDYYQKLLQEFPIISIEDALEQNDFEGFSKITNLLRNKVQIVGDDFFVTNIERLKKGITSSACNSILIKPNQIGTVTETISAVKMAQQANYTAIISHRSGETEDTSIADFAVGLDCMQIKTGSLTRTERIAKYNRLLNIENDLQEKSKYAGINCFYNLKLK